MVFQPDPEFPGEDDHRFVGKTHAGGKRRVVAANDVGFLVDLEPEAMTGAMRQTWQAIVGAEGVFGKHLAGRIVEARAGGADPGCVEDGLLRLALDPPGPFERAVRRPPAYRSW